MTRIIQLLLISTIFISCGEKVSIDRSTVQEIENIDTLHIDTKSISKPDVIKAFIEFMRKDDFVMDTIRLSQVGAWKDAAKSKKEVIENIVSMKFQFPVESYRKYLSDPKAYFFVKRNPQDSTKNRGLDFLLMTYEMDRNGIEIENEIYKSLSSFYLNFPTYCFRDSNRVYILTNRMTVEDDVTQKYSKILRDIIDPESVLFGHHSMDTIR